MFGDPITGFDLPPGDMEALTAALLSPTPPTLAQVAAEWSAQVAAEEAAREAAAADGRGAA